MQCAVDSGESVADNGATASTLVSQGSTRHAHGEDGGLPSIRPGTMIGEVYRVVGPLGTGAMGMVLLAQDESLDRRVAIKFIRGDLLDSNFRARFTEEARAMARVRHPNVLHIYAFGEHLGAPYFVMEYVDGTTLEQWRARTQPPVNLDLALRILEETCDGVSAIHAADTVHRDIKPSNILLDSRLRPRIADMGLAIFCRDDWPRKTEVAGTPAYMAPEIAFGRDVDPAHRARADVYSLACVAYELLTGKQPFEADTQVAQMLQHATVSPRPPSSVNPALPPEIDEAILRALAKDPAERTPTVDAFQREIRAVMRKEPEPERILVAEDDDDSREALKVYLQLRFPEAEIECVADGFSAIAAFDRRPSAVVILDLCMPGLDGLQVTEQLRAREEARKVPIIILTASGGPEQWKQLSALGADGFLVKPAAFDDVVALVQRALRERISNVGSRPQVPSPVPSAPA